MGFVTRDASRSAVNAGPVFLAGDSWVGITTSTITQVAYGPGAATAITVNTPGSASAVSLYDGTSNNVDISIDPPGVVSWTDHPFVAGGAVSLETTDALPTGLTAGTTYYVSINNLTADSFELADTKAHALAGTNTIDTTGTQSGTQTAFDLSNPIVTYNTTALADFKLGLNGAYVMNGVIAQTTDGGGAANITVFGNQ